MSKLRTGALGIIGIGLLVLSACAAPVAGKTAPAASSTATPSETKTSAPAASESKETENPTEVPGPLTAKKLSSEGLDPQQVEADIVDWVVAATNHWQEMEILAGRFIEEKDSQPAAQESLKDYRQRQGEAAPLLHYDPDRGWGIEITVPKEISSAADSKKMFYPRPSTLATAVDNAPPGAVLAILNEATPADIAAVKVANRFKSHSDYPDAPIEILIAPAMPAIHITLSRMNLDFDTGASTVDEVLYDGGLGQGQVLQVTTPRFEAIPGDLQLMVKVGGYSFENNFSFNGWRGNPRIEYGGWFAQ